VGTRDAQRRLRKHPRAVSPRENPRDCRSSVSISVGRAKYMRCRAESPTPRTAACIDDNSASPDFRWARTSSPALEQGPQAADQMTIPSMVNDRPAQDRARARIAGLPGGVRACHHRSSRSRSSTSLSQAPFADTIEVGRGSQSPRRYASHRGRHSRETALPRVRAWFPISGAHPC